MRVHRTAVVIALFLAVVNAGCDLFESTDPTPNCEPEQIEPAVGAVLDNGCGDHSDLKTWEFTWAPCSEAREYHLYVMGPNATLPAIDNREIPRTSYVRTDDSFVIDANRLGWTWKVRARIRGQWGPWSPSQTFDVEPRNTDCP